ncbi:MAG: hypothetical protein AB7F86_06600 [Bdellovibrionales bacterium]
MKRIVLSAIFAFSGVAMAQMDAGGSSSSGSGFSSRSNVHNFSIVASKNYGGFSLGAAYEYMYEAATGIGGHIRSFSKEGSYSGSGSGKLTARHEGLMIFGAMLGHHFFKKHWDLAFTPSFNIISIDSHYGTPSSTIPDDATTMGPGLSISLLWSITNSVGLGFDYSNYWVWFDDDWPGLRISDMGIKFKVAF